MSKQSKHNEDEVLQSLRRKKDCRIISQPETLESNGQKQLYEKTIFLLTGNDYKNSKTNDLGNGSWGKIDYLTKKCGYRILHVDEYPERPRKDKKHYS